MTAGSLAMRYHVGPHAVSTSMHVRIHQDNAESSIRGYQLVIHCTVGSLQVDERSRLGEQREEVRVVSSLQNLASVLGTCLAASSKVRCAVRWIRRATLNTISLSFPCLHRRYKNYHDTACSPYMEICVRYRVL